MHVRGLVVPGGTFLVAARSTAHASNTVSTQSSHKTVTQPQPISTGVTLALHCHSAPLFLMSPSHWVHCITSHQHTTLALAKYRDPRTCCCDSITVGPCLAQLFYGSLVQNPL
uniref:Uncharacterized protein n=1 Tax=Clastoptera arizonana TaxID=38151 RepID=A0A1B6DZ91_9HEMI